MNLKFKNVAIVVLADTHNPSILHPYFLTENKIVPESWEQAEDSPICTPALSRVVYTNGITVLVEGMGTNKLQVSAQAQDLDPRATPIGGIIAAYISTLPHVKYTAVGVNFAATIERPDPEQYIKLRFLAKGPWDQDDLQIKSAALTLQYGIERSMLRLIIDSGLVSSQRDGPAIASLLVSANYHTDLVSQNRLDEAKQAIAQYSARCDHFTDAVNRVLGSE